MTTLTAPRPAMDVGTAVLDRARRGDQEAFAALIRHYDPGLRALAYRLLGDRDRMDDALQEAYVKAFTALPRFRGESKIGTWLYRIAYNVCLDEGDEVAGRSDLARALAGLPPEERAAVLLVDAQGFSYDEAGRVLAVPAGTIASRLNRARAALRRALGADPEGAARP